MTTHELDRLRRKEIVGIAALVLWLFALIGANLPGVRENEFLVVNAGILGWALTAAWVAMDASYRRQKYVLWGLFTLMIAPLGFILYYLTRNYVQPVCLQCGAILRDASAACPACGGWTLQGRMRFHAQSLYNSLSSSLVHGPTERAKETVKHMSFALAAVVIVGALLLASSDPEGSPLRSLVSFVWTLSFAGYWVLVAWWVYLDGLWRRMEAVPWAILTLLTNVIGLVTYLVIRYPEPHTCPACGASLGTGLKRCPYCGAEAEPVCPRCQAPIKPDWLYCPSCSTKLPSRQDEPAPQPAATGPAAPATLTISGAVTDALTATPIANAEVKIDARSNAASTITDARGNFAIADLPPRPYVLIASAPGYTAASQSFTPSATGAQQLHFSLYPKDERR